MPMKTIFGLMLLLISSTFVKAQSVYSEPYQRVLVNIITCKPGGDTAKEIEKLKDSNQKAYLHHYNQFWQLMVLKTDIVADNYYRSFESSVEAIDKNAYGLLAQMYLQKCVVDYSMGKNIAALRSFMTAYSHYKSYVKKDSYSAESMKVSALFHILVGSLSDAQLSVVGWFGYEGNKAEGFELLQKYMNSDLPDGAKYEALMYYSYAQLKLGDDRAQSEALLTKPQVVWQGNFLKALQVQLAFKVHRMDGVQVVFDANTDFWLLLYLKVKYQLLTGNANGIVEGEEYLQKVEGNDYKADVLKYMAWYAFVQRDTVQYANQFNRILQLRSYPTEADKHAKYLAEHIQYPKVYLLQARMLFDAGQCEQALGVLLLNDNEVEVDDRAEYYYRLARNYDVMGKQYEAQINYQKTLSLSENDERYYGPYAAIYLSYICRNQGNIALAKAYLEQAKTLNTGEYKNAISKEVEMALKSLSGK